MGRSRTWKWFAANVRGLLTRPPVTYIEYELSGGRSRSVPVPSTRLGFALNPPKPPDE